MIISSELTLTVPPLAGDTAQKRGTAALEAVGHLAFLMHKFLLK